MSNAVPAAIAVILSGPSGVGKSTVCRHLFTQLNNTGFSVSCTTRAPRPGEEHGVHYNFVSQEESAARRDKGHYLEWAEVHGQFYGTPKSEVFPRLTAGTSVILDIDVQGARQIAGNIADTAWKKHFLTVFMAPPSLRVLAERLRGRKTEDTATVQRRLEAGIQEMQHWREYDYLLINDNADAAAATLAAIITAAKCRSIMCNKEPWL